MFEKLRAKARFHDTRKRVQRHGWTAIYVGDYESVPTWAYTIGLHTSLGTPEIVVFDVPMATANGLFHEIYNDLKSGTLSLCDREPWRPESGANPLVWRRVHESRLYDGDPENPWLGLAEDYAGVFAPERGPISAFQLAISDHDGHLPWEAQYNESLRPRQRELYLPLDEAVAAHPP
jgi:hypothetical protein